MAENTDITLTKLELANLTGTVQPARMVKWLTARGWVFEAPARRGDIPKVDRGYYKARMSGQVATQRRRGPNLDFMTRAKAA